jgi:Zn-dependent M28 family amino/carboxypeptidase
VKNPTHLASLLLLTSVGIVPWHGSVNDEGAGVESITAKEIAAHVTTLCSDEFEGRGAGTKGGRKAAEYIAQAFESFGLEAIDASGDFFQPFDARGKQTENVIGFLEGSHPERKNEVLVIGAHYDHLGKHPETGAIYHGADDDASGTSVMLEVAEAFARDEEAPERSLIFIAFGAEEMGLIGSKHYVANPLRPIAKTRWMVNLEMMGRGDEGKVTVMMLSQMPDALVDAIGGHAIEFGLEPVDGGTAHIRSGDQFPFHDAKIPILCFYGGDNHPDYHQPTDTADKIQPEWMQSVARVVYRSVAACANGDDVPSELQEQDD